LGVQQDSDYGTLCADKHRGVDCLVVVELVFIRGNGTERQNTGPHCVSRPLRYSTVLYGISLVVTGTIGGSKSQ